MKMKRHLMIRRHATALLITFLPALMIVPTANAQFRQKKCHPRQTLYTQRGLALSFAPGRVSYDAELCGLDTRRRADGAQFSLQYGCCRKIVFFSALSIATYEADDAEEWSTGYLDLGMRYSFFSAPDRRTRPYVSCSVGPAVLCSEDTFYGEPDHQYMGASLRVAAGLDYFLSRNVLLFVEVNQRAGEFDHVRHHGRKYNLADNPEFDASGFHVGLRFRL